MEAGAAADRADAEVDAEVAAQMEEMSLCAECGVEEPEGADSFRAWVHSELEQSPLHAQGYSELLGRAEHVVCDIRQRVFELSDKATWLRLMKRGRLLKEMNEALPVAARLIDWLESNPPPQKVTVMDLCSGVGYMSILLSELLQGTGYIERFVLIDIAFPRRPSELKAHHINPAHLSIEGLWTHELVHQRCDLKSDKGHQQLKKSVIDAAGPIAILGVHLCGVLSLRAVQLFNDHPRCCFLALKPCCLPAKEIAKKGSVWKLGGHTFAAREVAATGTYKSGKWTGSAPKSHEGRKFGIWANHLFASIEVAEAGGKKELADIQLISEELPDGAGHLQLYQTLFAFAHRPYCADKGNITGIDAPVDEARGFSTCTHGRQRNKCRECERISKEGLEQTDQANQAGDDANAEHSLSAVPRRQSCVAINCQPGLTDRYEQLLLAHELEVVESAPSTKGGRSWGPPTGSLGGVVVLSAPQAATPTHEAPSSVSTLNHLSAQLGFSRCAAHLYPTEWVADSIQICMDHLVNGTDPLVRPGQSVRIQVHPKSVWDLVLGSMEAAGVLLAPAQFDLLVLVHIGSSAVRYAVHQPQVWTSIQCGDQDSKATRAQHRTSEALHTIQGALTQRSCDLVFGSPGEQGGWTVAASMESCDTSPEMFGLYVCNVNYPGAELTAIVAEISSQLLPGGVLVLTLKHQKRCSARGHNQLEQECQLLLDEAFENVQVKFLFGNSLSERSIIAQKVGGAQIEPWELATFVPRPVVDARDFQDLEE